jgi:ppGpp synthetase/RelA/SpoT-type nucleotidyltranferase
MKRWGLGLRLGVMTAVIVATVMGGLTYLQQSWEIRRGLKERYALLNDFLAPLVVDLERAPSVGAMVERVREYQQACLERGQLDLRLELRDGNQRILASFFSDLALGFGTTNIHQKIPIFSDLLGPGSGTLAVWQDDALFTAEVHRRFESWATNTVLILLCTLVCLLVANHFLVTRPLRRLVEGVRRMGKGYLDGLEIPEGAWEWRWLSEHIKTLGEELGVTVRQLVEADRRTLQAQKGKETHGSDETALDSPQVLSAQMGSTKRNLYHQMLKTYLLDKCRVMESEKKDDPLVRQYAQEAWEKDVADAGRINEFQIRNRLDDAAFKFLFPKEHERVIRRLTAVVEEKRAWIQERETEIKKALKEKQVPILAIFSRTKHAAGVYRKMISENLTLEQIQDVIAFRIIVPKERDCYLALAVVHAVFSPELLRFKDYIAHPKQNGYQSLHTYVRAGDAPPFEIQIRTEEMQVRAEGGSAAHWQYKKSQASLVVEKMRPRRFGLFRRNNKEARD